MLVPIPLDGAQRPATQRSLAQSLPATHVFPLMQGVARGPTVDIGLGAIFDTVQARVGRGRLTLGEGVRARGVGAGVGGGATHEVVVPSAAVQGIEAIFAEQPVITVVSEQLILTLSAVEDVVTVAAVDRVVPVVSEQNVVVGITGDLILTVATEDHVVAGAAVEDVVAAAARDVVHPTHAIDGVLLAEAEDAVRSRGAGQRSLFWFPRMMFVPAGQQAGRWRGSASPAEWR